MVCNPRENNGIFIYIIIEVNYVNEMECCVSTKLVFVTINFWFFVSQNFSFVKFHLRTLVLVRRSMNLAGLSQASSSLKQNIYVQLIIVQTVVKCINGKPTYTDTWDLSVATDCRCNVHIVLTLQNWRQVYRCISRDNTRTCLTLYSFMRQ
jgi:hypothetical protein